MKSDQSLRHLAPECREDGLHAEPPHPGEDAVLQLHLPLVPPRTERPREAPDVSHPEPGQEGRPSEVLLQLPLTQAQPSPDSPPDFLLSVEGEGQVDTVESHPVDVFLPVSPLPPHSAVAGSADVLVVPGGGGGWGSV